MTSHCRHLKVATLVWYAAVPAGIWPEKLWENSSSRLELLGEAANEPPSTSTRRSRHSSTPHHHPLPQMQIDITITNGNSCLMEGKGSKKSRGGQCAQFFRRTHFCKNTGERRTFFAKIRALYGENTDKILVHVQSVIDLFAKQLNNALNLHYVYHQNTGVIRAIFHKCP